MNCTKDFVSSELTAILRGASTVAGNTDVAKTLRSCLDRLGAFGETSCKHPNTANAVVDADKIIAAIDTHPFVPNGAVFAAVNGDASVSNNLKTNLASPAAQDKLQKVADRLRDDAVQFKAACVAIATDPQFAQICQAQDWEWEWVIKVKRLGVPFADVITANPVSPPVQLGGGKMTATFRIDFGGNVGVRVFKENEQAVTTADTVKQYLHEHATATAFRVLSAARLEQLIVGKIPQQLRQQYPSLIGDCKLAIVRIGSVRFFGTAVTFFEGFQLAQQSKMENGLAQEQYFLNVDVGDANIRREATLLQSLDLLCGQVDRNPGNIMVRHEHGSRVVGIDQDFSFHESSNLSVVLTIVPPVFDKEWSTAVAAVTRNELDAALAGLSITEVNAAWARVQAYNALYAQAQPANRVTLANAANGERLWSQVAATEWPENTASFSDQHYVYVLYQPVNDAIALNKKHSDIVRKDNNKKACLPLDTTGSRFLYSRLANGT